jgi:rhodanese-related sulfurtransferase
VKNLKLSFVAAALFLALSSGLVFADGMTAGEMVAAAKAEITEITVADAKGLLDQGGYVFVDVREPNETAMGTIPGAVTIPRGLLEFRIGTAAAEKDAKIVVYCKSGGRSALATQTLGKMGYTAALSMNGGWTAWEEAGYPIE